MITDFRFIMLETYKQADRQTVRQTDGQRQWNIPAYILGVDNKNILDFSHAKLTIRIEYKRKPLQTTVKPVVL